MIIKTLKRAATNVQVGKDAIENYRAQPYHSSYAVIVAMHRMKQADIASLIVIHEGSHIQGDWSIAEDNEDTLRPIIQNKYWNRPGYTKRLWDTPVPAFRVFANGDVDQITISIDDE